MTDALTTPDTLPRAIAVRGVRHNTLRDLDVDVPLWHVVAIVGVSGSGKTSLAMGTLYAEGLYRFLEGLSTYSRRRMTQSQRPDVDRIEHLPPALALRQRPPIPGPRSTLGTMSGVLAVLRLMMSRLGDQQCPNGHMVKPAVATMGDFITCPECEAVFEHPSAESFSFNSTGACPDCDGLGRREQVDESEVIGDPDLTIEEGAVLPWNVGGRRLSRYVAAELGVRLDVPWRKLTKREKHIVLHGEPVKRRVTVPTSTGRVFTLDANYDNALAAASRTAKSDNARARRQGERFMVTDVCPTCDGSRLSPTALQAKLDGRDLAELTQLSLDEVRALADNLKLPKEIARITKGLVTELRNVLDPLLGLGLGYLTLDREGATLSTGERQRIELTSTVRADATGMLYVLDEPSVGLHPSNVEGLRDTIDALVRGGNSVVLVEHDVDVIRRADWVIELGPGAGEAGGTVIAEGTPEQLAKNPDSIIGPFLTGKRSVDRPTRERETQHEITLTITELYNLRDVTVTLPAGGLTAFAGPSGAGKTAIVLDSLIPAARATFDDLALPDHVERLDLGPIKDVVAIDASAIGQNARSTPATYSGVFDHLRRSFAETTKAKRRKWAAGHFSFNTREGQCPTCRGLGTVDIDVQYLPDINVTCPDCDGARFNDATLEVEVDGRTIADVLALTVDEALDAFADEPPIVRALSPIADVGLGYLRLGEPTPALSGGESQRLRIAARLRSSQRNVLYVFDEPSTGLHPLDIATLLDVFDRLLADGATVVVIDHDLDVLAAADKLIDVGPEGGPGGGRIVAEGTPAEVAAAKGSVTGPYLAR